MAADSLDISLIISTYNWPEALRLVLESLTHQTVMPNQIIVADDGSENTTKTLIDEFRPRFNIPLLHIWQERNGFQKTTILNKAIAAANCSYIVQMDGDIITHPGFVQDHANIAEKGYYVRGSRTLLGAPLTHRLISQKKLRRIKAYTAGIKNRINAIHQPVISSLLTKYRNASSNVHGCNLAYWRDDFIKINGYDNRFKGWGHEDIELAARFVNNGILQKKVKMKAVCYHLDHPLVKRSQAERNFGWYLETVRTGLRSCADGYEQQKTHQYKQTLDYFPTV